MSEIRLDLKTLGDATEWLERLQSGSANKADIEAWLRWCDENEANSTAFEQVRQLGPLSRSLCEEFPLAAALNGDVDPRNEIPCESDNPDRETLGLVRSFWLSAARILRPLAIAAAASAVVAALIVRFGAYSEQDVTREVQATSQPIVLTVPSVADQVARISADKPSPELASDAAPLIDDFQESRFPDGSKIQLAPGSSVKVNYSAAERAVDLQSGEAYFTVAPDEKRPFVVAASEFTARAVGTAFNVRRARNRVVVSVTEGLVAVNRSGIDGHGRREAPIELSAGFQLRWGGGDEVPIISPITAEIALAWQRGRLHYIEEPIGSVIADFNRYSKRKARIGSDAIWHIRFTGTLFTDDAQQWLEGLPGVFPVRILEDEQGFFITTRTDEGAAS